MGITIFIVFFPFPKCSLTKKFRILRINSDIYIKNSEGTKFKENKKNKYSTNTNTIMQHEVIHGKDIEG